MAASPELRARRVSDVPPHRARLLLALASAGAGLALLWAFPLFRIVPLKPAGGTTSGAVAFDAVATASSIWKTDLPKAAARASELKSFAGLLRADPASAQRRFAKNTGLGTAYFFVRGGGKVIARERNTVLLALDGAEPVTVALRIGPVFGNAVRDGCGFLDVNAFPGLQEFNALAAELNALVEKNVIPTLREKATVGAHVDFAGCAEAPETVGGTGEPLLALIPVEAEVR